MLSLKLKDNSKIGNLQTKLQTKANLDLRDKLFFE